MTDLAVYEPSSNLPVRAGVPGSEEFDSWIIVAHDVIKLSNVIYDTPFVPDGLRGSAPAVAAAILAGRELGLAPLTSLANIHVIKGKPALSALLMRALVQAQGHQWQDGDVSDVRAVVRGRRSGDSEWTEVIFTAAQAKLAGIDLGKYPQDKLYARASVRLARRKFADVIMGMPYSDEDLEDGIASEGTVTETPAVAEQNGSPAKPAEPRTAQRKARTQAKPDPAPPLPPATASPPSASATGDSLPPLPGEDAPDPGKPGSVTPDQLTALWATFTTDFGFTKDDKAQARETVEKIIGRKLLGGTTGNLSEREASMAIDTLKRCGTRERLVALLATGEMPADDAPDGEAP